MSSSRWIASSTKRNRRLLGPPCGFLTVRAMWEGPLSTIRLSTMWRRTRGFSSRFRMTMKEYMGYYIVAINLITLAVFAWDKDRAKRRGRRVSEKTLLFLCLIGGAFGGFLAMRFLRHKNRKPSMRWPIVMMTLMWAVILMILATRWS